MTGDGSLMRSVSTFSVSTISAVLVKDAGCDDHGILLSTSDSASWERSSTTGVVRLVWDCSYKKIFGQYSSTYTTCSSYATYTVSITVSSYDIYFADDRCGSLYISDSIGANSVYVYVGADADSGVAEFKSLEVNSCPTPQPT